MKITLGRNPNNTIVVDGRYDTVSSNHAEIEYTADGRFLFIDHSTNGSMVNNQKVHNGSMYVSEGDRIYLANAYEVSWPEIRTKAQMGRVTVQRNIHGEANGGGRVDSYTGNHEVNYPPNQPVYPQPQINSQPTAEELSRWNWGGFLLSWIWALGNKVWWGLLALIPGIGFIVNIILGINGTRAAWEACNGDSPDVFWGRQHSWTVAGLIVFGIGILLDLVVFIVIGLSL